MTATFGIELEATFPMNEMSRALERERSSYHGGQQQAPYFPDGWYAQSDSSIRLERADDWMAAELISPVLSFPHGLWAVSEAVDQMRAMDAHTNPSCGLHVHVGLPRPDVETLERLQALYKRYEFAFYGATGAFIASRMASEHGRHYCKSSLHPTGDDPHEDRYRGINFTRLEGRRASQQTVEFRMFQSSTNLDRVVSAIGMAVAVIEESLCSSPVGEAVRITSPIAAMREFLAGPWERIEDQLTEHDDLKRTLMRQARKAEIRLGIV